jgi:hypothetical protein
LFFSAGVIEGTSQVIAVPNGNGPPIVAASDTSLLRLLNHFIIEFLASALLMYSSVYVPENGHDFMKQYVSSVAILAVMLTIKDKAYFCPDGTFMTTAVLAFSGAYTDRKKKTDFMDISVRVLGQVLGWVTVCFVIVGQNKSLFIYGAPGYYYSADGVTENAIVNVSWFTVFNEFLATVVECIAISFMVMPLLNAYETSSGGDAGFMSKEEATPPKNKNLLFAAASLGVLHYVLERLFRSTMNPFVFIMHQYMKNSSDFGFIASVVGVQLLALVCACLYCYFLLPSQKVMETILGS